MFDATRSEDYTGSDDWLTFNRVNIKNVSKFFPADADAFVNFMMFIRKQLINIFVYRLVTFPTFQNQAFLKIARNSVRKCI